MFSKALIIVLVTISSVFMCAKLAKAQVVTVVTDGLISYWTFDEADIEGDTVNDVWGENHGTMVNSPKIIEGKVRSALEFDGTSFVDCGNDESSDFVDGITVEAWVKVNGWTGADAHISKKGLVFSAWIQDSTHKPAWSPHVGGGWQTMYGSDPLDTGEWYHYAATYNGSARIIFINGEDEGNMKLSGPLNTTADNVRIAVDSPTNEKFLDGCLDEVRVYSRALTEEEIQQNFKSQGMTAIDCSDKLSITWGMIKARL